MRVVKNTKPKMTLERLAEMMQAEFLSIRERLDRIETRLDSLEVRLDSLEVRVESLEVRIGGLEARMDNVEAKLDRAIDAHGARIGRIESRLDLKPNL